MPLSLTRDKFLSPQYSQVVHKLLYIAFAESIAKGGHVWAEFYRAATVANDFRNALIVDAALPLGEL